MRLFKTPKSLSVYILTANITGPLAQQIKSEALEPNDENEVRTV